MKFKEFVGVGCVFLIFLLVLESFLLETEESTDWPMWGANHGRSNVVTHSLPSELKVGWSRKLPKARRAWNDPSNYQLDFDASYEPIVVGKLLVLSSMNDDTVTAYNTDSGKRVWVFYAEGPVRFAPVAWKNSLFVISDDGFLYSLALDSGRLNWKYASSPRSHKVLGNGRLCAIDTPRGGPVVYDNKVYFGSGIYSFMGTFIHCLDATTGKVKWVNSGSGSMFQMQPHHSPSFAGISPKGYLTVTDKYLIVPGGRSAPAVYDRISGEILKFMGDTNFTVGGCRVSAMDEYFFIRDGIFKSESFKMEGKKGGLYTRDKVYSINKGSLQVSAFPGKKRGGKRKQIFGGKYRYGFFTDIYDFEELATVKIPLNVTRLHIKAGNRLYASTDDGVIYSIEDPLENNKAATIKIGNIPGGVFSMLAGDDKLFAVSKDGAIHSFCTEPISKMIYTQEKTDIPPDPAWSKQASDILEASEESNGYAVSLGIGSGGLIREFLRQSSYELIVIESDESKLMSLRKEMTEAALYGNRITILKGDPFEYNLPPYLAGLMFSENLFTAGFTGKQQEVENMFRILRPYNGTAYLFAYSSLDDVHKRINIILSDAKLPNASLEKKDSMVILKRKGALPGSGDWTSQYANAANTVASRDNVKGPLGVLWYGGPSNMDVLPRHAHGPSPQVVAGRVIIQGINVMSARDVYTGRILWKKKFEKLDTEGRYYDKSYKKDQSLGFYFGQKHIPGANESSSNYVTTENRVYLNLGEKIVVLSASTGETLKEISLSTKDSSVNIGYIGVEDDFLVLTSEPVFVPFPKNKKKSHAKGKKSATESLEKELEKASTKIKENAPFGSISKVLTLMDRMSGEILWQKEAESVFRHNAIAIGNGLIFCIDKYSDLQTKILSKRGKIDVKPGILSAFSLSNGNLLWKSTRNIKGTWLGYDVDRDILIESGRAASDSALDESYFGIRAYKGRTGTLLWERLQPFIGPPVLTEGKVISQNGGGSSVNIAPGYILDINTGKELKVTHPITGEDTPACWIRFKGCNTAVAGKNILSFRSGSAAYMDMTRGYGTVTLGGFKSGCTSNLIPANGVLNAPDYTRTCICAYQNQASLAMVPMDDIELWSYELLPYEKEQRAVDRIGINFSAPGNFAADDGTLWTEFPSIGGLSPDIPIIVKGGKRYHHKNIFFKGEDSAVFASGIEGVEEIKIRPFVQARQRGKVYDSFENNPKKIIDWKSRTIKGSFPQGAYYTVTLYFAEPDEFSAGARKFTVKLQGKEVLKNLNPSEVARGPRKGLVRTFERVLIKEDLKIAFEQLAGKPVISGVKLHRTR